MVVLCWVVIRGLPVLALSRVLFVYWYLLLRRLIVDSFTFGRLATTRPAIPASSMPMTLSLMSARNRGMVKQQ